ncbi:hypothetical protein DFH09DRAFT_1110790 [Mycena vulgaris]|nr:hypothetical protein DFH09DRAFT_1110790 [Mycena vulgaris]
MAPSKNTPKPKGMFKPYDELDVPDIMPLPELALIATTKGEATAVPKLNEYQRSWILDVGVRGVDLPSLAGKAASEFYDKVKQDAFEAKAFQHTTRVQDRVEEAGLPALVAAWKQQHPAKNKNAKDEDDNASEEEEDEGGRVALLRGYTKGASPFRRLSVTSGQLKGRNARPGTTTLPTTPTRGNRSELAKLLGLAAYTGRDKFRDDRHDEIHEYSKTLKGTSNAGGKFRKAEAEMWAKENQASWEDAAAADEDVDWVERQKLVASGFRQMVQTLHATRKFRPFVATMLMAWMNDEGHVQFEWQVVEAVPDDIRMPQAFEKQYKELVKESVDAMHDWAENPLKEHLATRADSAKRAPPVFPLTAEALGDVSPKKLAETVTTFLAESYGARFSFTKYGGNTNFDSTEVAFGSQDIPWAAISSAPTDYYDAALPVTSALPFASTGLTGLSLVQWYELATALAVNAGRGTSGFFRKLLAPPPRPSTPPPPPRRSPSLGSPPPGPSPPLPRRSPAPGSPSSRPSTPPPPPRRSPSLGSSTARSSTPPPPPPPPHVLEGDEMQEAPKKMSGKKRRAGTQLVPEDDGAEADAADEGGKRRRTTRSRKTPQEARLEREQQAAAAAGAPKAKPRYEYQERSPAKAKQPAKKSLAGLKCWCGLKLLTGNELKSEKGWNRLELKIGSFYFIPGGAAELVDHRLVRRDCEPLEIREDP